MKDDLESSSSNAKISNEVAWNGMKKEKDMQRMHVGYNSDENSFRRIITRTTNEFLPRMVKSLMPNSLKDRQRPHSIAISSPSKKNNLGNTLLDPSLQPQKTIMILGLDQQNIAQRFLQQLHFIIPSSATSFHFSPLCQPILPKGKLLDVESSPCQSRSRYTGRDAGTRLECSSDYKFQYRRIGDLRLSFLHVSSVPKFLVTSDQSSASPYPSWLDLRSVGEYSSDKSLSPRIEREIQTKRYWSILTSKVRLLMLFLYYDALICHE